MFFVSKAPAPIEPTVTAQQPKSTTVSPAAAHTGFRWLVVFLSVTAADLPVGTQGSHCPKPGTGACASLFVFLPSLHLLPSAPASLPGSLFSCTTLHSCVLCRLSWAVGKPFLRGSWNRNDHGLCQHPVSFCSSIGYSCHSTWHSSMKHLTMWCVLHSHLAHSSPRRTTLSNTDRVSPLLLLMPQFKHFHSHFRTRNLWFRAVHLHWVAELELELQCAALQHQFFCAVVWGQEW